MKAEKSGYYWITTVFRNGELLIGWWGVDGVWMVLDWPGVPEHGEIEDKDVTGIFGAALEPPWDLIPDEH